MHGVMSSLLISFPLIIASVFLPGCLAGRPAPPSSSYIETGLEAPLSDRSYRLHLCERGEKASSEVREENGWLTVFGKCGEAGGGTPVLQLSCGLVFEPEMIVPYRGYSYEVILKKCGPLPYGKAAAQALKEYGEAHHLAFQWENLATVRKFAIMAYLDTFGVRLPSTSGIQGRIHMLYQRYEEDPYRDFLTQEEAIAQAIQRLYSLAFRLLDKNGA